MNEPNELEALESLLASDGWAAYEQLIRFIYTTERLRVDLKNLAKGSDDYAKIGAMTAAKLLEYDVADTLLTLPRERVNQLRRLEDKQ